MKESWSEKRVSRTTCGGCNVASGLLTMSTNYAAQHDDGQQTLVINEQQATEISASSLIYIYTVCVSECAHKILL